jgi:peptidoglycan/LPS O-acetylase OafA/YrhL
MSTWGITQAELTAMLISAALVAGGVLAWARSYGYPQSEFTVRGKWVSAGSVKFRELERERVLASAKGIAASASGFVVTLVTGYLKDGITRTVSLWSLVGCIVGAAGCLWLAASTSGSTRAFVRNV